MQVIHFPKVWGFHPQSKKAPSASRKLGLLLPEYTCWWLWFHEKKRRASKNRPAAAEEKMISIKMPLRERASERARKLFDMPLNTCIMVHFCLTDPIRNVTSLSNPAARPPARPPARRPAAATAFLRRSPPPPPPPHRPARGTWRPAEEGGPVSARLSPPLSLSLPLFGWPLTNYITRRHVAS